MRVCRLCCATTTTKPPNQHNTPQQHPTNPQQVECYASQGPLTFLHHLGRTAALLDVLGQQIVLNVTGEGLDRLEACFKQMVRERCGCVSCVVVFKQMVRGVVGRG